MSLLPTDYALSGFFDEMFTPPEDGRVRQHYRRLAEGLAALAPDEFDRRRAAVDAAFLRRGVTFTV
ncbi:MAG: circularly permuted type 2 ATP-grasp protein, partial [Opitutaceae bacterium]